MFLFLLLAAAAAAGFAYWKTRQRFAAFSTPVLIDVPRGTSTRELALRLAEAGVIERPEWLLAARAIAFRSRIQAGEYEFARPDSPAGVLARLARGDVYLRELMIPEGSTIFDIAERTERAGFAKAEAMLAVARPLEGYLFPATYRFPKGVSAQQIVRAMQDRFKQTWRELGGKEPPSKDVVTLASLVEKEAVVAEDRPLIAGVFRNRLAKGMTLDCDPTVMYAAMLEGKWRGTIYRSDLDRQHPYNTYRNKGLPPGPIASPGADSLRAALNPAETSYVFFVANPDRSGRHIFSKTMAEHNRAVAQYRRGQAAGRGAGKRANRGSAKPARHAGR